MSRFQTHALSGLQRCIGCWSRDPERVYVTCPAAWDGPVERTAHQTRVHDDVILCSLCISDAAGQLPEVVDRVADAEGQVVELATALEQQRRFAASLQRAIQDKPAARPQPKRKAAA